MSELVNKPQGAIARRVSGDKPKGVEEVDFNTDIKMPRLAILQPTSGIVVDGKATMGQLAHSITQEVFGDTVEFIALFMTKSRVMFKQGEGLVMLSRNNDIVDFAAEDMEQYIGRSIEEVPHEKDKTKSAIEWAGKEPPSFNLVYNIFCLLTNERLKDFPICLSLMKTATSCAKKFISAVTFSGEDMFARVYRLKTHREENDKGKFAVPDIEFVRRCTDEEYAYATSAYKEYYHKRRDIAVDLESEGENFTDA